jgi:enoyl-CoA hydratase/carnithine racemase
VDVAARAEIAAGAAQDDRLHLIIVVEFVEGRAQFLVAVEGQRILALGPVERDRRDAVFIAPQEMLRRELQRIEGHALVPPSIVIAAVEGVCAGAGAILAMASDIRFAKPGARTAFLFVRVGLSGADMGACAILPRIIGSGRAAELMFTGRDMTTDEGLAWGFYNRVVEDAAGEAHALAAELAKGPSIAHCITKRQLDNEWNMTINEALEAEARVQARCMETKDFKRAYEAFANKRTPEFKGD